MRTEYFVEGPNNTGAYHIKRVEWTPTRHGINRAAILHGMFATKEAAEAAMPA
jgi:hypothetical protein